MFNEIGQLTNFTIEKSVQSVLIGRLCTKRHLPQKVKLFFFFKVFPWRHYTISSTKITSNLLSTRLLSPHRKAPRSQVICLKERQQLLMPLSLKSNVISSYAFKAPLSQCLKINQNNLIVKFKSILFSFMSY